MGEGGRAGGNTLKKDNGEKKYKTNNNKLSSRRHCSQLLGRNPNWNADHTTRFHTAVRKTKKKVEQ